GCPTTSQRTSSKPWSVTDDSGDTAWYAANARRGGSTRHRQAVAARRPKTGLRKSGLLRCVGAGGLAEPPACCLRASATVDRRALGSVHEAISARDGASRGAAPHRAAGSARHADEFFDWLLLRESLALPSIAARRAAARARREGRYPAFRI